MSDQSSDPEASNGSQRPHSPQHNQDQANNNHSDNDESDVDDSPSPSESGEVGDPSDSGESDELEDLCFQDFTRLTSEKPNSITSYLLAPSKNPKGKNVSESSALDGVSTVSSTPSKASRASFANDANEDATSDRLERNSDIGLNDANRVGGRNGTREKGWADGNGDRVDRTERTGNRNGENGHRRISSTNPRTASLIDESVKKAHRQVRKQRDNKRKKLVEVVLKECRDKVLYKLSRKLEEMSPMMATSVDVSQNYGFSTIGQFVGSERGANEMQQKSKANGRKRAIEADESDIVYSERKRMRQTYIGHSGQNGLHNSGKEAPQSKLMVEFSDSDSDMDCNNGTQKYPSDLGLPSGCQSDANSEIQTRGDPNTNISNAADSVMTERNGATKDQKVISYQYMQPIQPIIFSRLPANDDPIHPLFDSPFCRPCIDSSIKATSRSTNTNEVDNQGSNSGTANEDVTTDITDSAPKLLPFNLPKPEQYSNYSVRYKFRGSNSRNSKQHPQQNRQHQPLLLQGTHPPRPLSSATIFLKSLFSVDDERYLSYLPYFGDDDKEDVVSELFDVEKRLRLAEYGPPYRERETMETMKEILGVLAGGDPMLFLRELEEADDDKKNDKKVGGGEQSEKDDSNVNEEIEKNGQLEESKPSYSQSDRHTLNRIHGVIAELLNVRVEKVREQHLACFARGGSGTASALKKENEISNMVNLCGDHSNNGEKEEKHDENSNPEFHSNNAALDKQPDNISNPAPESDILLKNNSETTVPISYENAMDSYRDLFCRRCFTYDCNLHGNIPKANLDLLGELAVQKERDGHWKELDKDVNLDELDPDDGKSSNNIDENANANSDLKPAKLTPIQQSICERAFLIFQGNIPKIALAIGATPQSVQDYITSNNIKLHAPQFVSSIATTPSKRKKEKTDYTSMKHYNQKWLSRIQSVEIHPAFIPCDHDEPCSDKTCSCIRNAFFCTKHCGWGSKSRNFFRGCSCKAGQCRSNVCVCFAAKRECDPDLCRTCGACSDPPNQPATGEGQRCRNDNMSMRRHAHLLLAESSIVDAGWGVYTKHALKKGDFVHEYLGEVISQEEAERRGIIYDKQNRSYLFNLTSDLCVDALRKGNKTKYVNHSSKPNCEPRMISVNGDIRIGLFAKEDIDAQSELFFDYRYDAHIDNDLIIKPAHNVAWMQDPKMANKINKKRS